MPGSSPLIALTNAVGHGALKPFGASHRDDSLSNRDTLRVTKGKKRQSGAFDFDYCHIVRRAFRQHSINNENAPLLILTMAESALSMT